MKLEGGQISPGQIIFLVMSFCLGPVLLKSIAVEAGHADWLAIMLGLAGGVLIAFIFTSLCIKFPGKTLVEFIEIIYGPLLGKLISLVYLFYFFLLPTLTLRLFGDFLTGLIFTQTPMVVIISLIVLICASAVRNGIEVIARCSQVLLPLTIIMLLLATIFSIPHMEFNRFMPIFEVPWAEFLRISLYSSTFPFGQSVAFLMIFAFIGIDSKKIKKARFSLILGLIGVGLLLILLVLRNRGILGATKVITVYPSYQALRIIDIGEVLTRLEIIVAINFLTMGFIAISLLYYNTALGLAQILKLRSYLPLVLPIGILMVCTSIIQFENIFEYQHFSGDIVPLFALPLQIGIPILSLIICKIRGLPKKE
ncbi:MAG: hypothetical protein JM58_12190 [Peptococcaceae bacterium BICA1-8]|nr:MAG: hypothetical protein JM58_12190 [Peptococcaceae bacterium BICA1-8]